MSATRTMPLFTSDLQFPSASSMSYGSMPHASVSPSFNSLDTTEQVSGPTCKTLRMLSPYAFFKMGTALCNSNVHEKSPTGSISIYVFKYLLSQRNYNFDSKCSQKQPNLIETSLGLTIKYLHITSCKHLP